MERVTKTSAFVFSGTFTALVLFFLLIFAPCAFCEETKEVKNEVNLDADSVSYEEHSGIAKAAGNVKVRNKELTLSAPYAEYNSKNHTLEAFSDKTGNVTFTTGANRLSGEYMRYNLETRRGVLTKAYGKMEAFYMKGRDVEVMPIEDAQKRGIVRPSQKGLSSDQIVAEWLDVTATTCDLANPHYRLVTKKIIVIPNKKIIVKHPKLYMGKTYLFTYPFDVITKIGGASDDQSVLPFFTYDSGKGVGVGIKGPIDIGNLGELKIAAVYWSDNIWEAKLRYQKELLDGLYIYAESNRFYNKDEQESLWRPRFGIQYYTNGWKFHLYESQRELIETEMRPGQERRFNVWRSPEFSVDTPWYGSASHIGQIRAFGIYGRYQDNVGVIKPWVKRLAVGAEFRGMPDVGAAVIRPYYGARYTYHSYDMDDMTQEVTDGWIGLKWKVGAVSFDSYFFKRWVSGTTPLAWDRYAEREDFYQTVSFPLPFGSSLEKWTFSVRAGYDNIKKSVADIRYTLNYNKHCMTWQLWAKDSRANDELTMGLTFYINAYPEYMIHLGSDGIGRTKEGF